MSEGFFAPATTRKALPLLPSCGKCGLYKTCRSPKMQVAGQGKRKVLIVGEAPGKDEDRLGEPFVGKTGQRLRDAARRFGVDLNRDCWLANAARCRPERNLLPEKVVEHCRPLNVKAIRELKPDTIILLGGAAVKSVLGWLWREDPGAMSRWAGYRIPCQSLNAWVCPTFHPSFVEREERRVLDRMWEVHLKAAFALKGRPWDVVPDYGDEVEVVYFDEAAADKLLAIAANGPIAFDFECDGLKPDRKDFYVACCSVSNGTYTVAFPWGSKVQEALGTVAADPAVLKIASNMKYEDRVCRRLYGKPVRGWDHDTMLAAHGIDNRPGITSIKFQAFVLLGQESYDDEIKPYLKSDGGGNSKNRVRDVSMAKLLRYCGMDSLLEWKVAMIQKEILRGRKLDRGVPPHRLGGGDGVGDV